MADVVTLDGLNLNDLSLYFLLPGFDPGEDEVDFDVFKKWNGSISVRNVSRVDVVEMKLPLDVRGTSEATMLAGVAAINAKIATATFNAPKTLVVGSSSYSVIDSKQIRLKKDELYYINVARISITLNRMPLA